MQVTKIEVLTRFPHTVVTFRTLIPFVIPNPIKLVIPLSTMIPYYPTEPWSSHIIPYYPRWFTPYYPDVLKFIQNSPICFPYPMAPLSVTLLVSMFLLSGAVTFSPLSMLSPALRGAAAGALGHLEAVAFGLADVGNALKIPRGLSGLRWEF